MIKKIVFTTDFSSLSREALDYTLTLAEKVGAKVIVSHAVRIPSTSYSAFDFPKEYEDELKEESRTRLSQFVESARRAKGPEIESRLTVGFPEQVVRQLVAKESPELIVAAKHSRSTLERFFMGSTTEKILRNAPCPVLVVPDRGLKSVKWDPVVCAVDFSPTSRNSLQFAVQLSRATHTALQVLHVTGPVPTLKGFGDQIGSILLKINEGARNELREWIKTSGAPAGTGIVVDDGEPSSTIIETMEKLGSDLLVIGRYGHSRLEEALLGSTTNAVLRGAKFPVLVVPGRWSETG